MNISLIVSIVGWSIFSLFCLVMIFKCFLIVRQQNVGVIERFGKFNRVVTSVFVWILKRTLEIEPSIKISPVI